MRTEKEVTVIIPNYNGIAYIETCLQSLQAQDCDCFDIVVVDNCSDDGSRALVEEKFPQVRLLALAQNFGFSRAVNEGLRVSHTPFVILLNNDTQAAPGFVSALLAAIKKNDRIFSVSSKMLKMQEPDRIDDAGDLYCALGWAFSPGRDKPAARYEKRSAVFSACAGASIFRRPVFEVIGYFDEFHFAYLEDVDMGYRARIMGYENIYEPAAVVYHAGSGSTGSRYNDFKIRLSSRNSIYLIYKNMPALQIILNLPFLCLGYLIKSFYFIRLGYGRAYLSGFKWGYLLCTKGKKFPYSKEHLKNYARIQLELWVNMLRRITG